MSFHAFIFKSESKRPIIFPDLRTSIFLGHLWITFPQRVEVAVVVVVIVAAQSPRLRKAVAVVVVWLFLVPSRARIPEDVAELPRGGSRDAVIVAVVAVVVVVVAAVN